MARDPDYIKKMERLDNEVSDAELAAKQEPTGWFPAAPYKAKDASGVEQNFLDKKSYLKWEQAKKRRDTEYSKHLDEEEALVKTLPASAGTLRDSQLEMIAKQRAGLMLDTPPKKEVPPPENKPAPAKDVPSNTEKVSDKPLDPEALAWAKANPKDPRAAEYLKKYGGDAAASTTSTAAPKASSKSDYRIYMKAKDELEKLQKNAPPKTISVRAGVE